MNPLNYPVTQLAELKNFPENLKRKSKKVLIDKGIIRIKDWLKR